MKKENISDALNMLSDDIIEETDRLRQGSARVKAKQRYVKWGTLAACACLFAAGAFVWNFAGNWQSGIPTVSVPEDSKQNGLSEDTVTEPDDGVYIPKLDVSLCADSAADMIGFFIYRGNCYTQYTFSNNAKVDFIGEKLGTATGLIDEWTPSSGYVEFAGSVRGDFYEVKGYDPSFMLCMKNEVAGSVTGARLFIRSTGWRLKYGSELFEDKMHISENYSALRYEERDSWYYGKHHVLELEGNDELIKKFIADLDSAEFLFLDSVPLNEKYESIFDTKLYHLCLNMKNGSCASFHFLQGGYVVFAGIPDICVKISEKTYKEMIEAFEMHD